jgi:osmoprotectant transport system permease protein
MKRFGIAWFVVLLALSVNAAARDPIVVGSKNFNESYLLAEIVSRLLESRGHRVDRRFGLGGTLICYEALRNGEIDVYVEYTGTLSQAILSLDRTPSIEEFNSLLADEGLEVLPSLGFNNTYAMALRRERAESLGIATVSDLVGKRDLVIAVSHEFLEREDGWPGLMRVYGFDSIPTGIEHGLAYQAIAEGRIDVTDAYSTDGDLERYGLTVLEDDKRFFPEYMAVPFIRTDVASDVRVSIGELAGRLNDDAMRKLNAAVVVHSRTFDDVALEWLTEQGLIEPGGQARSRLWDSLARNTVTHLKLTGIALLLACLIGLPAGILVYRSEVLSRSVLYVAGLLQTIPSIALLALMIPLFGIGEVPAIIALFLYSLLPILRNTVTAMLTTDPLLRRVAAAMGLTTFQQIRYLLFPMALPNVLAGVRTAAVISIGTATLAAFIGAGGLGDPIVTGLALNDPSMILQGAIPAALLAVATELSFEMIERLLIPRHLMAATI